MPEAQAAMADRAGFAKPGPWRMLLWKEWRQQRWTLFGMTALVLALFALGGTLLKRWSFELSGAAYVFALAGIPLVLSARAFAGEDDDGTAVFLRELPFRPLQVFAAKFLMVVLASWAAGSVLLPLGPLWTGCPDSVLAGGLGLFMLLVLWMVAPMAAALASLLASAGLRSLTTALLTAASLCACAFFAYHSVRGLGLVRVQPLTGLAVLLGMPGLSIPLAVWLSVPRHSRTQVQCMRGTAGCIAVVALFLLPAALAHSYLSVWATPTAYLRPNWLSRGLGWACISVPASDRPGAILIECGLVASRVASVALLDPSTGRAAWIDRRALPVTQTDTGKGNAEWSPDGSRVLWGSFVAVPRADAEANRPADAFWRSEDTPHAASAIERCVYDLTTHRTTRFPGALRFLSPVSLGSPWYDSHWLAEVTLEGKPGVVTARFLNVDDGTTRVLPVPLGGTAAQWQWLRVALAPGRVLCIAGCHPGKDGVMGELVIAKCTPDATAASLVRVGGPLPGELKAVSPDGRWALFAPMDWGVSDARLDLVDLDSGAVRAVELPAETADFRGDRRRGVYVRGFVAGGKGVLVSNLTTFAVYDLGQGAWVSCAMPSPEFAVYTGQLPPISPDGRRVFQVFRGGTDALKELPAAGQGADSAWQAVERMPERSDTAETCAVVADLTSGRMIRIPLVDFSDGPAFSPTATWFGNEHILVLSSSGISRYGLDGSREVLYP
jgi:hypothetical protein